MSVDFRMWFVLPTDPEELRYCMIDVKQEKHRTHAPITHFEIFRAA